VAGAGGGDKGASKELRAAEAASGGCWWRGGDDKGAELDGAVE